MTPGPRAVAPNQAPSVRASLDSARTAHGNARGRADDASDRPEPADEEEPEQQQAIGPGAERDAA